MPHDQDVEGANDPDSVSTYECLQCGNVVESKTHPGECDCGGEFQNRAKSLE
ncbi:rubrerythrin-like domain-containing protein [Natribaculum luteum]|uniref:Rubrerythrin-like domain-containing protein n=1 Tax=Natribaculum luteum TaxID=1586232 RepID=A0ABD5NTX9_9EURY|nr:rubrerythrin-like domain-containing protein [Natribaculum luteum]